MATGTAGVRQIQHTQSSSFCFHFAGYKYELALVLNGTAAIPNLNSLEQQVFQSFRKPATPLTPSLGSLTSAPQTPHSAPHPRGPGKNRTPATPRKCTKDHFNYLLMDPLVLDKLNSTSSGMQCGVKMIFNNLSVCCRFGAVSNLCGECVLCWERQELTLGTTPQGCQQQQL